MDHKVRKIKLSAELAAQKIKSWCAYQERSQHETRQKLYDYGLQEDEVEATIAGLISENFVNEERFAVALAGGKFRIKQWGRNKIKQEFKKHRISEYCINKGLKAINGDEYMLVLERLIEKKLRSLKGGNEQKNFYSAYAYLVSRGFEGDLVSERLNELRKNKEYEFRPQE